MGNNKCLHHWEEIAENKFWCLKCGSLRIEVYSYMSDRVSLKYRSPELYKEYTEGKLKYDR